MGEAKKVKRDEKTQIPPATNSSLAKWRVQC